jgi:hypothetical protein
MTYRTHAARFTAGSSHYTNGVHNTLEAAEAESAALLRDGWTSVVIFDTDGDVVSRAVQTSPDITDNKKRRIREAMAEALADPQNQRVLEELAKR